MYLKPTDKIILFTDGITETWCKDEMFGEEKFFQILNDNRYESVSKITDLVKDTIYKYSDGKFEDDITMLGIEIL